MPQCCWRVFCAYPSRFQLHSLHPVESLDTPVNGGVGSRTPVRNAGDVTYSLKRVKASIQN